MLDAVERLLDARQIDRGDEMVDGARHEAKPDDGFPASFRAIEEQLVAGLATLIVERTRAEAVSYLGRELRKNGLYAARLALAILRESAEGRRDSLEMFRATRLMPVRTQVRTRDAMRWREHFKVEVSEDGSTSAVLSENSPLRLHGFPGIDVTLFHLL